MQRLCIGAQRWLRSDVSPRGAYARWLPRSRRPCPNFVRWAESCRAKSNASRSNGKEKLSSNGKSEEELKAEQAEILEYLDLNDGDGEGAKPAEPVVRWYEQMFPWSKDRRLSDPDTPSIEESGQIKELKAEIDRMSKILEEVDPTKKSVSELATPMLDKIDPETRKELEDDIRKAEAEIKWRKQMAEQAPELEIKWELPSKENGYLRHLNSSVHEAASNSESYLVRRDLWLSYARCKAFLPPFLHLVPVETWNVIFDTFALSAVREDAHWAPRLIQVVQDMREAGRTLQGHQLMIYIEALRAEGRQKEAIREWQDLADNIGDVPRVRSEFELLGVRLFTSQGDLGKAEELASKFLKTGDKGESRILIPILDTWAQRKDDIGLQHAWALYLRLKMELGKSIKIEDYDNVFMSFLRGDRVDLALAVFKDMMLAGQTGFDSLEIYKRSVDFVGKMHEQASTTPDVNKIHLTSMTLMPRSFENKYFYGKWMKRLIGMDEVDSAAAVVDLMYERGVTPDARHINGIIGGWLRSTKKSDEVKAEQMAWAMIQQRLSFVRERREQQGVAARTEKELEIDVPEHLKRTVPKATIETYSILLHHYGLNYKYDEARSLQDALELGEVAPNSFWVNHLIYMDLRRGNLTFAWERYIDYFQAKVEPDLETFAALWECEKAHQDNLAWAESSFPSPRRIMQEMVSWLEGRGKKRLRVSQEEFNTALYRVIVGSFAQSQDFAGAIVAAHVLRDWFTAYPGRNTTHKIILEMSESLARESAEEKTARKRRSPIPRKKVHEQRMKSLMKLVKQQRIQVLNDAGYDDLDDIPESFMREERLHILAQYLKALLSKTEADKDPDELIWQAAREMGVSQMNMEDPLSSLPPP